jgi:ketosteroid isomerase-like protein
MSVSENKAATQAAYQAFGVGDLEGAMKDRADDIEWTEQAIGPSAAPTEARTRSRASS